ncbi:MAG: hypothetical protein PHS79_03210 [Patescibacteria group bacterium]|nr:hypothetical protein [Patescibacteria group bacterium]
MIKTCTFLLCQQYPSASGYFALWETDGMSEQVTQTDETHVRVTVTEGQYLFLLQEQPGEQYEGSSMLMRVPVGEAFETFKELAEREAGQPVYDRISGYKNGPRFGGGPYDYTNGFDGGWLKQLAVRTWSESENPYPTNLQEAIELLR